jgi:hypothetical protein
MQAVQSYREFPRLRISLPTAAYARGSGVAGALVELYEHFRHFLR